MIVLADSNSSQAIYKGNPLDLNAGFVSKYSPLYFLKRKYYRRNSHRLRRLIPIQMDNIVLRMPFSFIGQLIAYAFGISFMTDSKTHMLMSI